MEYVGDRGVLLVLKEVTKANDDRRSADMKKMRNIGCLLVLLVERNI